MIITTLQEASRYEVLHPLFPVLFAYLREHDLLHTELGRITVQDDDLFINNVAPQTTPVEKSVLEMHRDYIDVHVVLEGEETFGWLDLADVKAYSKPYSAEGDCALSTDVSQNFVTLRPGQVAIVWPEDAHAPALGPGPLRKLICKVKI